MRFFKISLVLFLFGCGPSPEEIEKTSNELFEEAVSMTDSEPCLKLDAFEKMIRFNSENEASHNIIRARKLMEPLEVECEYKNTRTKSSLQEKKNEKLKSIVFNCDSPKVFESNAYANEATYVITGNYLSHDFTYSRNRVFGEPVGNFYKYFDFDIYIRLSKDENSNNYENYDSYVLDEFGNIFLSSGKLNGENIKEYWLFLKNKDKRTSFGLSRDNFKLTSGTQYETVALEHRIVGRYFVDWTFKYSSGCRTINVENLHSHVFSITENIKRKKIEDERKKKEQSERDEALKNKKQKEKNKI